MRMNCLEVWKENLITQAVRKDFLFYVLVRTEGISSVKTSKWVSRVCLKGP